MTSKGSLLSQLRRAAAAGNLLTVRAIAAELDFIPLDAALEITLLIAEREPQRYDAAARRWLARLLDERPATSLIDFADAARALALLPTDAAAAAQLEALRARIRRRWRRQRPRTANAIVHCSAPPGLRCRSSSFAS